jgi:hypothetical protein
MPPRTCLRCSRPTTSPRHKLCDVCRARSIAGRRWRDSHRQHLKSSTARGYGVVHQKLRARWAPIVEAGGVACARCGFLIAPGEPFDLDHSDDDRTQYNGPAHAGCNRSRRKKHDDIQTTQTRYRSPNY